MKGCFYIRDPAGKPLDWIEKVVVDLHPTFNPPKVTLTKEPFEVNRIGWGTFQIEASCGASS
jgi:transcription initiation factor IIF auxiliary subunit